MRDKKTVNLLLANSEGRVSNLIEALVRDVCDNQAVVHCTRATRMEELNRQVSEEKFDLVILIPEKLSSVATTSGSSDCYAKAADSIRNLKAQGPARAIAVGVPFEHQAALSEAGADCVLDLPFRCDEVKSSVRELLHLPLGSEPEATPSGGSLFSWFQRLTSGN